MTVKDLEEATKISHTLLEKKLVACVNIVKEVQSHFWWQGKIDQATEALLVIKTQKALLKSIIKSVRSLHSYTVPEIIALPIIAGHKGYLDWVRNSTSH